MKVTFYQTTKRENSTFRPSEGGIDYQCLLKEDTSVIRPAIEIATGDNMQAYNLCWIADFNRWYFIEDWVINRGGRWTAYLKCDILATCKDRIGAATQYVIRSASQFDTNVVDVTYPTKTNPSVVNTNINLYEWMPFYSFMTFVLGVVNGNAKESGAVTYYAMDADGVSKVREYMLSGVKDWGTIKDFSGDIAKAFIDPFQYVVSCTAFPIPVTEITNMTGVADTVKFGFWDSGINAKRLTRLYFELGKKGFTVPKHPQSAANGNWLNSAPYTQRTFYSEPWGNITLDANILATTTMMWTNLVVDLVTGDCTLLINTGQGDSPYKPDGLLASAVAKIGIEQQLSASQTKAFMAGGLKGGLLEAGHAIIGDIANVFAGGEIGDALQSAGSAVTTQGKNGGYDSAFLMANAGASLQSVFYLLVNVDVASRGRPLCKNVKIDTLSGFVQLADGDIGINNTQAEQKELKAYLEEGFFYE